MKPIRASASDGRVHVHASSCRAVMAARLEGRGQARTCVVGA